MDKNQAFNQTTSQKNRASYQSNDGNAPVANSKPTDEALIGAICPNCDARLEGRKCKLLCPTLGCGYMVTCSEW